MTPAFRTAAPADLVQVLDWAAAEGWNPGLDDAAAFHAADPQGFFLAERDGAAVAAISVVDHSDSFAFLGLYLCQPEWRGQGIGYALWTHALAHAGTRTVGLDGVAAQQANYAKSGFVLTGATLRLEGDLAPQPAPEIRAATPEDSARLLALDSAANGVERPRFLSAWTASGPQRRTVVLGSAQGPVGFATARLCRTGCKIGPIVAPDSEAALALARAALDAIGGSRAIIDVPEDNAALASALRKQGFAETFATARMYRGAPPQTGPALQAIATMELG